MEKTVTYDKVYPYRDMLNYKGVCPALQIILSNPDINTAKFNTVGLIDTGAVNSIFSGEIATAIKIDDISSGVLVKQTTYGGETIDTFRHDVIISFGEKTFDSQICFVEDTLPYNLLGRSFLDSINLGVNEQYLEFYI